MVKYREYSRELTPKELENLKKRYSNHLKSAHGGFLTDKQRKRLLGMKKKEQGTPDSDFWWRIRESTHDAIIDMKMICDIANEKELQEIFGTKQIKKQPNDKYPITEVLSSLLPSMLSEEILNERVNQTKRAIENAKIDLSHNKDRPDEVKRLSDWIKNWEPILREQINELPDEVKKLKEQEWRKIILEDVLVEILIWYFYSGIFKTNKEKEMIFDMIDQITVASSGIKRYELKKDMTKMDIVKFR
ncbi:protein of unknown function [Nitrosotalea devaniterrae]|uniref:Uncharacterized protein n=1 Tax=Nitrosotalea devaniterrae TaxID=1078905 RepID=A0A128A3W0_9ARCH|nr:protein of unknown function [Candidatus Nitrosotalea devanaterra]